MIDTPASDSFKKAWKDCYDVRIEACNKGPRMIYGAWRNPTLVGPVRRKRSLLQTVRQKVPKARSRNYFEAEISMDSPAPDWREAKVLWRLRKDKEFELEVVALLTEIVDVAEDHLDQLVRSQSKA